MSNVYEINADKYQQPKYHNPVLEELTQIRKLLETMLQEQTKPMVEKEEGDYFTVKQAAKYANKSASTIRRWIKEERIVAVKLNNGIQQDHYLICKQNLKRYVENGGLWKN